MMKYYVLPLSLLLATALPRPVSGQNPPAGAMTLTAVWEQAEAGNRQIRLQQQELAGSKEKVLAVRDTRLPALTVDGVYSRLANMPLYVDGILHAPQQFPVSHEHYSAGSNLYLNLYNGGQTNREISMAQTEQDISNDRLQQSIAETRYQSALHFLELYRHHQFKTLLEQDIHASELQLTEIQQLYKNGLVLKSDVLREEVKIANQRLSLTEIINQIAISTQRLNYLMGRPDTSALYPIVELPQLAGAAPDTSSQQAIEYKLAQKNIGLGALRLDQVKAAPLPKVGFFAEYHYTYPQTAFYPYSRVPWSWGQTGVSVSLPLSAFYVNRHKTREAHMAWQRLQTVAASIQDKLRQDIHASWLHYQEAVQQTIVARNNLAHATESLRILRSSYFNQQSLFSDLLDAETQLLQSKFNLTTALVKVQVQHYQLLRLTGKI
ncbi:TolC family protein [Chitinophaga qingshengii]|uniref:TolC family protein n=1 Tax=Chitinophaga qingshengii TaxID=1569794 RepID=A0ABR7TUW1_9BACT|nr:TolC family protein [Chitinophaga qingshengii]MBC9933179.1 TolC family protein [Chitinophaga qingshengii]